MVRFKKYVNINNRDLDLAIREGVRPMQEFYDKEHGYLPYFGNYMSGGNKFGNWHDFSYSLSHMLGRWLNALLNAEDVSDVKFDEDVIENLKNGLTPPSRLPGSDFLRV